MVLWHALRKRTVICAICICSTSLFGSLPRGKMGQNLTPPPAPPRFSSQHASTGAGERELPPWLDALLTFPVFRDLGSPRKCSTSFRPPGRVMRDARLCGKSSRSMMFIYLFILFNPHHNNTPSSICQARIAALSTSRQCSHLGLGFRSKYWILRVLRFWFRFRFWDLGFGV